MRATAICSGALSKQNRIICFRSQRVRVRMPPPRTRQSPQNSSDMAASSHAAGFFRCTAIVMRPMRRSWARYLPPGLLALSLVTLALRAQEPSSEYREAILAIQQQIQAGHLDDAKLQANAALKRYTANGGLENLLGIIAIQQGDAEQAKQEFSSAIVHEPRLVSAYLNLARIWRALSSSTTKPCNWNPRMPRRTSRRQPCSQLSTNISSQWITCAASTPAPANRSERRR